jgi:hypothetical protein
MSCACLGSRLRCGRWRWTPTARRAYKNAEYHAFLTKRGASKIRAGQHVSVWINDPKMDKQHYGAEAMVAGIRNNPDSEVPSP